MPHVLIVDDEAGFASGIADLLRLHDHSVATAASLGSARELLKKHVPDLLLLDLMLPDGSGLELLDNFEERRPQRIVIITGHSGIKSLIGEMAGDGVSFMKKPIEPNEILGVLNTIADAESDRAETGSLRFGHLVGESEPMKKVYAAIEKVAATDSTVFIEGESGTGKELVASALHRESGRSGQFVPVNCGGLTPELASSLLFGHEKGSFTGAGRQHKGFFERADGGTLFLDEITEMPVEMQTHLLRVLETGKILRVGGEAEIDVSPRLVAATNRNPAKAVEKGIFREDLYFRLQVFPIALPPLRERRGDIPLLAQHFLVQLNEKHGTAKVFATDAIERLEVHTWPGNVRELKHTIHRAYIVADGDTVDVADAFENEVPARIEGVRAGRSIADVEKDLILATLEHFRGDKNAAASSLGISMKTLYNRLKSYESDDSS